MKQFVVLLALVSPLALAEAEASYGSQGGALAGAVGVAVAQRVATAPHCETTFDTSQQIILPTLNSSFDTKHFAWRSHLNFGLSISAGVVCILLAQCALLCCLALYLMIKWYKKRDLSSRTSVGRCETEKEVIANASVCQF